MSRDIRARAGLTETEVTATLQLGDTTLTLAFPRNNEAAADDMSFLVAQAEEAFTTALGALAEAAVAANEKTAAEKGA